MSNELQYDNNVTKRLQIVIHLNHATSTNSAHAVSFSIQTVCSLPEEANGIGVNRRTNKSLGGAMMLGSH